MAQINGEVLIRRPAEEVFDFVADERNESMYNPAMVDVEKITEGPIGLGTRFAATMITNRRPLRIEIEYTGFDRPRSLTSMSCMAAADFAGTLTVTPEADGTHLRWSWQMRPKGALRLLAPLLEPVGARRERAVWARLRDFLEAGGAELR
ncbi:SRPBCC family protein [Paractinoplanes durhamensis]|uniref:SRPBCC family protein n=1 Tax=Paractinoplanes durhamensis TaxID=113563 RepID=A0ABQ3YRJ7_9ACTN|nr:SRPBCC family protein [Actinoplanes durhamensis]GIE00215.1 hypothetical protein Adu01nite_15650 [Actinoplanes durhamensis]